MTDKVSIFRPKPDPVSEITDVYLKLRRQGQVPGVRRHNIDVPLKAETYHALAAIAARQGLAITPLVNRIMEGIVEEYGEPGEPFST